MALSYYLWNLFLHLCSICDQRSYHNESSTPVPHTWSGNRTWILGYRPDSAGLNAVSELDRSVQVLCEDRRAEAVHRAVGTSDHFIHRLELHDLHDWTKDLPTQPLKLISFHTRPCQYGEGQWQSHKGSGGTYLPTFKNMGLTIRNFHVSFNSFFL